MTPATDDIETRVRAALRAEADGVEPGADSLATIRRRTRAARTRRRLVVTGVGTAAVLAAALAVPLVRDDGDRVSTGDDPSPTITTVPDAPPSTVPSAPTAPTTVTPAPTPDLTAALWPDPAGELFADPVAAARSFLSEVVGLDNPPLSAFRPGEPGAGEVDLFRVTDDGRPMDRVASTITLRQLDGEHWFVTRATSADVRIDSPAPQAEVGSPLAVAGEGHGYEATIIVQLRARAAGADILAEAVTAGGSGEALEPFSAELTFTAATTPVGILIASDTSGASDAVSGFSAVPVRLTTTSGANPGYEFPAPALWPFRTQAEADAWLVADAEGHSPWHADAAATAQFFTTGYLGFTEIDRITSQDVRADEAWIGVGYEAEPGVVATSAVIHLRRFGPTPDAPWEVVGSRDTVLTLDTPEYGSQLTEALRVGGTITGVDESVHVQVRQSSGVIGDSCCVPAGGDATRWEIPPVNITGQATDPALTVVAWSGGHVQEVEIFAITAVRP
jgi:Immunoglobulin-like domain of bacterial spore germination